MTLRTLFLAGLACILLGGCDRPSSPTPTPPAAIPKPAPPLLLELRKLSPTQLTRRGPAPARAETLVPPEGVREVTYPSGDLQLKAWLALPDDARASHPAVVYFHSGFALGTSDYAEARVFLDAGFAVMMPMLRGENGNPGNFELFWGELDDAIAAVEWLADRDEISRDHVFTFGHSIGGGISALLSLADSDVPIRHGGSCGGLYSPDVFQQWSEIIPFDASDSTECSLRTLFKHVESMRREHHAYLGIGDPLAANRGSFYGTNLQKHLVLGDHQTSLLPSLVDYATRIHRDVFGDSRSLPQSLEPMEWKHPDSVPIESAISDLDEPELWDVSVDPFPGEIAHFRGDVRCPVTILAKTYGDQRGDFLLPIGFEPVAKLTQHPSAAGAPSGFIDLSTMLVTTQTGGAVFETLFRNLYGLGERPGRQVFHWPGTSEEIRHSPDDEIGRVGSGVYGVSPGGRYVVAITSNKRLVVWESRTRAFVGDLPLPILPGLDAEYLSVAELGFAPDGREFAAVIGTAGKMWLMNWNWESGVITASHPVVSPWSSRTPRHPNRYQLQFLEDGQGWLVEFGRTIIDRDTGKRRNAFAADTFTGSTTRAIAGNRVIATWQNPASLFLHEVATFPLRIKVESQPE